SSVVLPSASIWTKLMTEPGVFQKTPGLQLMILRNQDAAWQDTERPFQNAHILVEHQRLNSGAVQQRHHRRDQDRIVCTDKFAHGPMSGSSCRNYEPRRGLSWSSCLLQPHKIGLIKTM